MSSDAREVRVAEHGAHVRSDIIIGVGGKQALVEADPAGNPIELFEPTRAEASLSSRPSNDRGPAAARGGERRVVKTVRRGGATSGTLTGCH